MVTKYSKDCACYKTSYMNQRTPQAMSTVLPSSLAHSSLPRGRWHAGKACLRQLDQRIVRHLQCSRTAAVVRRQPHASLHTVEGGPNQRPIIGRQHGVHPVLRLDGQRMEVDTDGAGSKHGQPCNPCNL